MSFIYTAAFADGDHTVPTAVVLSIDCESYAEDCPAASSLSCRAAADHSGECKLPTGDEREPEGQSEAGRR